MSVYIIKEGQHSSGFHFMPLFNIREMSALVRFDKTCIYTPEKYQGVNKLFGFSEGLNHMKNSVRMGWTSDGVGIKVHYFEHKDGKFFSSEAFDVPVGKWVLMDVRSNKTHFFGYRLYPYFGGQNPAPHDMKIEIKWQ